MTAPLRLTFGRWYNKRRPARDHDGQPSEQWSKVLAHTGHLTQFEYGTDNQAANPASDHQRCIICAPHTGVFAVDVDYPQEYAGTRTAQLIDRDQAMSVRDDRYHVLVDARAVPPGQWPEQKPIAGADIKSNGWVPVPGSVHWSGEPYKPNVRPDGLTPVIPATPELVAAILADQADCKASRNGHGGGGTGGGHDGEVAAKTKGMILRRLRAGWQPGPELMEDVYKEWVTVAIPRNPSWGYDRDDFERHYGDERGGGLAAALEDFAAEQQVITYPGAATAGWAQQQAPPVTCEQAEKVYAKWLHDPDPVPTRLVLAAYAANMALPGDPVWVMLVGGSGIGKTERIMPVTSMPHVVMASTLTGEAALLSATPKRERAKNATGGVLRQVGDHGVLVVKDFTSVLSMSRDRRAEVIAALREVYDGRWDRHYGTDGGQVLTWQGKCGFIAGVTTAIDGAHSVLDAMGTRFLFVRLPDADDDQIALSALDHAGQEEQMRAELAEVTAGLLGNLGQPRQIHQGVRTWLVPLARLASKGRSPVERDYQGEIALVLDAEAPTRLIKQLGQLWRACGMLGLDEARSWEVVRRAGLDSIPKLRRAVIGHLGKSAGTWQRTTEVAQAVSHPSRTTLRTLQDLAAHGLVVQDREEQGMRVIYSWALASQALGWWQALNPLS